MRKLTVKNFSVIKDAELEFGKITVLIGPQSAGKSLLCKLAYFLGRETIELAIRSIANLASLTAFKSILKAQFIRRFTANSGLGGNAFVMFSAYHFAIELSWEDFEGNEEIQIDFSSEFEAEYGNLLAACSNQNIGGGIQRNYSQDNIRVRLNLLFGDGFIFDTYYIPAGRAFFTNVALGINALRNPDIDPLVSEFATTIAWNTNRVSLSSEDAKRALWEILAKMVEIAGGHVEGTSDAPVFVTKGNRQISFPLLSSGIQELLPMFNVLGRLASNREKQVIFIESEETASAFRRLVISKKLIYLEEPEAHIFPGTQYELVQLFTWFSGEPTQDFSWVITTHSPYILTAFNTLIEAWRVGSKEGKREQVASLVPEKYWVNESDFAAYTIRDGVLVPIFEKEQEGKEGSGLIDGDYLDSVSDQLGGEFEKLLDIEYAN